MKSIEKGQSSDGHAGSSSITKKVLGLCMGASTVSAVELIVENGKPLPSVASFITNSHEGQPKETLIKTLKAFDLSSIDRIAATGRRFREFLNLASISEPEAVERAYAYVKTKNKNNGNAEIDSPAIVSAGGETFMVYVLNKYGKISNVLTGNKCASGTGEFFLQQLRRMDVTLEDASRWAAMEEPYSVSGRCSVFCKSDCTHATNKGIPKSKVTAGLCMMMADKILELLKKVPRKNIMVIGGTVKNPMMIEYLQNEIQDLVTPDEAPYFEALGAALWAIENKTDVRPMPELEKLFKSEITSFDRLEPLKNFHHMVEFKQMERDEVKPGDECIVGLDVGSTTTKAVLIRTNDSTILASCYLRTNGDPVGASKNCYSELLSQVQKTLGQAGAEEISITGLGVCGSGRQIAGLHALTDGVINEIIAHAEAAVFFDPGVDTLFEIGGQDAKYTYITNSVPSDYAMNEACSAGTGSFLEESALETLGVPMDKIAEAAFSGSNPPNFNDQCAAFISSDIKNAIHEGIAHEDIVAGLVYSICMNYSNRVKGNRPVGEKVFMQGGVCYNETIPLAMAALTGKPIIVPPEPGLMGAFGVALEVKKRIQAGIMSVKSFDLQTLASREVKYHKPFICRGGQEKCDRRCEVAVIGIEDKKYPFGGACNKYYNLRRNIKLDTEKHDLTKFRQKLVFDRFGANKPVAGLESESHLEAGQRINKRIGFNRSFLVNTYYPLYSTFFTEIGLDIVLPDTPDQKGIDKREAPFCYPAELTHGFFSTLVNMEAPPDYIFLPHFKAVPAADGESESEVCPFVQGETFFLRSTFQEEIRKLKANGTVLLTPLLDLTGGMEAAKTPLVDIAKRMGIFPGKAEEAFKKALGQQKACFEEMKKKGRQALIELEKNPEKIAVVIFGRPYNAFTDEAHMGIPHKLASRGVTAIPFDCLLYEQKKNKKHMYWGMGQQILKAATFVSEHPQLFGTFITNFSCGPDSFLIGYFRDIMGQKPSLTLELDSHTADAGLETRIEAFLDIVSAYRQLKAGRQLGSKSSVFTPAKIEYKNTRANVITSQGEKLKITDPRVTFLVPSMGTFSSETMAAAFRGGGYNAVAHKPPNEAILKMGRANTTCKECLPLILTTGTLLDYVNNMRIKDEVLVYFMATASGPCRFGQYYIFMEDLVNRLEIQDTAMLPLTSENAYAGLGLKLQLRIWWGVVIADVMEDMRSMLLANAQEPKNAMALYHRECDELLNIIENGSIPRLEKQLKTCAENLKKIPLKKHPDQVPKIALVGEIYVRRDGLSRQHLTEKLAEKGFAVICAPISEWLVYSDYIFCTGLTFDRGNIFSRIGQSIKTGLLAGAEKKIKSILSTSGLVHSEPIQIKKIIRIGGKYISRNLTGEAILTVGTALSEAATIACGVIAVGPFGCMPNRLSESILNQAMTSQEKIASEPDNEKLREVLSGVDDLPFLAVETDGSPFPQLINAKLETFCLRADRLFDRMQGRISN